MMKEESMFLFLFVCLFDQIFMKNRSDQEHQLIKMNLRSHKLTPLSGSKFAAMLYTWVQ